MSDYFSTWNLIRISGFLAYFLFTVSISTGLIGRLSAFRRSKPFMNELHNTSGWTGLLATIFHMAILLIDQYAPYELKEVFIPFLAKDAPISSAFGTISFYLFIIVIASSDFFRKKLGQPLWKKLHFTVIPAWMLMLLHGIMIGTDTEQFWASLLYSGGAIWIIILMILRYLEGRLKVHYKTQK